MNLRTSVTQRFLWGKAVKDALTFTDKYLCFFKFTYNYIGKIYYQFSVTLIHLCCSILPIDILNRTGSMFYLGIKLSHTIKF